ncbi:hypothetical protein GQ607_008011 [Colletotrichum asianum]|uniref:Uncharacterized protein n=1 Tax=Colletotrichum asianum TaxID=702518 RepID=A0A8H3WEF7_9PEZI|nr:hypothetical protein GQ607_008011 [Colletotrichum asianum]
MLVEEPAYGLGERGREARCLAFTLTSPHVVSPIALYKPIISHSLPQFQYSIRLPDPTQHPPHPHPKKGKKTQTLPGSQNTSQGEQSVSHEGPLPRPSPYSAIYHPRATTVSLLPRRQISLAREPAGAMLACGRIAVLGRTGAGCD